VPSGEKSEVFSSSRFHDDKGQSVAASSLTANRVEEKKTKARGQMFNGKDKERPGLYAYDI
jgi:hypothetical protein